MGRRRRLTPEPHRFTEPDLHRTYMHGLLVSYPCLAVRTRRRPSDYVRNPPMDGKQCYGQMRLQPVVAQHEDWQMLSYLCGTCGRVAWEFTCDAPTLPSEQEPS